MNTFDANKVLGNFVEWMATDYATDCLNDMIMDYNLPRGEIKKALEDELKRLFGREIHATIYDA